MRIKNRRQHKSSDRKLISDRPSTTPSTFPWSLVQSRLSENLIPYVCSSDSNNSQSQPKIPNGFYMIQPKSDINIDAVTLQQDSELNTTLELAQYIDRVIKDLSANLSVRSQNLETGVQKELSKLLNILCRIKRLVSSSKFQKKKQLQGEVETLTNLIVFAFEALHENRNLALAARIRSNAERTIRRLELPLIGNVLNAIDNAIDRFLEATSTGLKILIGLVLAIPLFLVTPLCIIIFLDGLSYVLQESDLISQTEDARTSKIPAIYIKDFRESATLITLSFIAGSTGAIISILTRVSEYNTPQYEDKYSVSFLPIFIGLFKPIIGGTFGVLVFAMLNTHWLSILGNAERTDHKWFSVVSITFVTGFSERLAKDLIGKVEQSVTTNQSSVVTVQERGAGDQEQALGQDKSRDQEQALGQDKSSDRE
ncbi:MAG: hypothetical protein AB4426_34370 [Xenococcaceae cyanobacterium]